MRLGRRDFFRQTGAWLGALAMFGLSHHLQGGKGAETRSPSIAPTAEGELYHGFVLLPEGAPVPDFVQPSRLGIPIVCGVGAGRGGPSVKAIVKSFETPALLKKASGFPMYTFSQLPKGLRPVGAYLVQHESGEIFGTSVQFEAFNAQIKTWDSCVAVWGEPDFSRPFPLWSSNPVEPGGPAVILEKVDFLPTPGIMIKTQAGYYFHWIQDDVLYGMRAEYNAPFKEVKALATSLVVIN